MTRRTTADDAAQEPQINAGEPDAAAEPQADAAQADAAAESPGALDEPLDPRLAQWLADHIHNGPIARNGDCFEQLRRALPALQQHLKET